MTARLQHFGDAVGGHRGPWQQDEHERQHQEGEDDLDGILHERHHVANLDARLRHLVAPTQMIASVQPAHDQHHARLHEHHDPVDEQDGVCQVTVGPVETVQLEILPVEGPDHHHARQVFAATRLSRSTSFWITWNLGREIEKMIATMATSATTATAIIHHIEAALADGQDDAADAHDGRVKDHAHHAS